MLYNGNRTESGILNAHKDDCYGVCSIKWVAKHDNIAKTRVMSDDRFVRPCHPNPTESIDFPNDAWYNIGYVGDASFSGLINARLALIGFDSRKWMPEARKLALQGHSP